MKGFVLSFSLLLLGCSGNTFTTAGADATTDGTSGDDGGATDGASGGGGGDVYAPDGACACVPYWCGCGLCNPGDIACTVNPPGCPLACASACPELQLTRCRCDEGRCIRDGVDASDIGCITTQDCPQGQCCAHIQGRGHCAADGNTCCNLACP